MFYIVLAVLAVVVVILKCVSISRMKVRRLAVEAAAEEKLAQRGLALVSVRKLRRNGKLGLLALQAMAPQASTRIALVASAVSETSRSSAARTKAWLGTAEVTAVDESDKLRQFSLRIACPRRLRGDLAKRIRIEWTPSLSTIMTDDQKGGLAAELDALGALQEDDASDEAAL